MAMTVKYYGTFRSVQGILYRVEILTNDTSTIQQEVLFPYDTPVEIEWHKTDLLEPVQGSCLTLSLSSETDRQFLDLFSIETGTIRIDVYRNGTLYWSGMLDPELYEEPYSYNKDYDVSFTFSDFAILDRKKWNQRGIISLQAIIDICLAATGINYMEVRKFISTKPSAGYSAPINLSGYYIQCDNFYDEEGEAMTLRKVLEGILKPFAMRVIQKGGRIYLYDLNAAYSAMPRQQVQWYSADAMLDTSPVYNNVRVTFSPYANTSLINGSLNHDDVLPDITEGNVYMIGYDPNNTGAVSQEGFRIICGVQDNMPLVLSHGAQFFRIDAIYSGSDEAGVAFAYKGTASNYNNLVFGQGFLRVFNNAGTVISQPIITTQRAFIVSGAANSKYKLRISMQLLCDVRYNPFESPSDVNEEDNAQRLNDWCNFGYVPCMLYLKDAEGNILYHYENKEVMLSDSFDGMQRWGSGQGQWGDMFLAYYDKDDRKSKSGFGGWQSNGIIIGYYRGELPKKFTYMHDGDYIPLPPVAGFIELQIGSGIHQFDYDREVKDIYSSLRWLLYKEPKVTIVRANGTDIDTGDIEDAAWVNREAREELPLDTIVGTCTDMCRIPSSRGSIIDMNNHMVQTFGRAGTDARLERLLIGTVYSQYASRHYILSGTARILSDMAVLQDASSLGKYLILSEVQNLLQDTSEIQMSEFAQDNFDAVEFIE